MKIFGYEPALIMGVVSSVLGLVVTLGIGLNANTATAITAGISGLLSFVVGIMTRPIAPAIFTGFFAILADLAANFGYNVSTGTVGAVNAVVMALFMFHTRAHVTPTLKKIYQTQAPATVQPNSN